MMILLGVRETFEWHSFSRTIMKGGEISLIVKKMVRL